MNDRPTAPPHDPTDGRPTGDELVSAVLDGAATEEQVATVAADPVLAARLESFRSLRDDHVALATTEAAALVGSAEHRIAAALAAAGEPGGLDPATTGPATDLATRSTRRSSHRARRLPFAAGVAAAIVLVVAVVGLGIRSASDGSDQDSSAASADSSAAPSGSAEDGRSMEQSGQGAAESFDQVGGDLTTTIAPPGADGFDRASSVPASESPTAAATSALPELGSFAALPELLAAAGDPARLVGLGAGSLPCPDLFAPSTVVRAAAASLDGRPVLVIREGDTLHVVDLATCRLER
jgi:hypothetical protein